MRTSRIRKLFFSSATKNKKHSVKCLHLSQQESVNIFKVNYCEGNEDSKINFCKSIDKNKKTFKPKVSSSRQKRQREGSDADHLAPKTQKLIASASSPSAATSKDRSQPDTDLITSSASLSKDRSQPANDLISSTAAPSNANSKDRSQPIATSKDSSPSASGQPKEPLQQNVEATNSLDVVSSIPTPTTSSCKRSQTQSTADLSKSTHKRQKKRPAAAVKIQEPQKPSTSAETPSSPAKTIGQPHQKATPEASAENFSTLLPSADASSSINTHPSSSGSVVDTYPKQTISDLLAFTLEKTAEITTSTPPALKTSRQSNTKLPQLGKVMKRAPSLPRWTKDEIDELYKVSSGVLFS
jgi:hypothetical protein